MTKTKSLKNVLLLVFAVVISNFLHAADTLSIVDSGRQKRMQYFFSAGMGGMTGCNCKGPGNVVNFTLSTIQGVRVGRHLSAGAGTGYDSYETWRAVPFFGTVSWDLFGKKNKIFAQMNYGYAAAWIDSYDRTFGYLNSSGGRFINPSIGYRITTGKLRIYFSAGYKLQRVVSTYAMPGSRDYWNQDMIDPETITRARTDMRRAVFAIHLGIN